MLFVDAMLHISHNLENGLGFLEVDAKMELLEARKDLTKLIHGFVKVRTCGKSPAKMRIVRVECEVFLNPAWLYVMINCSTKKSSNRSPQDRRACAALPKSPFGANMSSHMLVSEEVAHLREPSEQNLLRGDVDTRVVEGLLHVGPQDVIKSRRQIEAELETPTSDRFSLPLMLLMNVESGLSTCIADMIAVCIDLSESRTSGPTLQICTLGIATNQVQDVLPGLADESTHDALAQTGLDPNGSPVKR